MNRTYVKNRLAAVAVAVGLLGVAAQVYAAVIVTESEPNNTKSAADAFSLGAAGVQLQGVSVNQDDKDFFVFTAGASGRLSVSVSNPNGGRTAALQVEDQFGVKVLETEPNNGVNSATGQVRAGVRYFVRLRSKTKSAAAYVASLSLQ